MMCPHEFIHHYCVPTALSILTGIPIDEVESQLKTNYLGDIEIKDIYLGLAIKFLSDNGYYWYVDGKEGIPLQKFSQMVNSTINNEEHLREMQNHALVLKNGKIFDNKYRQDVAITNYDRRANRIIRAYRIIK